MSAPARHRNPDVPLVLTAASRRPPVSRAAAAGLRHVDRPWAVGIDALLCVLLIGLMAWEGWEFGNDAEWQHMAASVGALVALALHGMRAFTTPDRED